MQLPHKIKLTLMHSHHPPIEHQIFIEKSEFFEIKEHKRK